MAENSAEFPAMQKESAQSERRLCRFFLFAELYQFVCAMQFARFPYISGANSLQICPIARECSGIDL